MNFWSQFEGTNCLPDKCNCEFIQDAFIRQPIATWTSLIYIFFAYVLYQQVRTRSFDLKAWTAATVMLGLSSFWGHASFTRFIMSIDFASIIMILSFFAFFNLMRLLNQSALRITVIFTIYYAALVGMMYWMEKWTKVIVCVLIFIFALADMTREMGWSFLKARMLQYSILVLVVSFSMFMLDELRIVCDPHSPLQLHSLWHIGTAFSVYLYGRWRFLGQSA